MTAEEDLSISWQSLLEALPDGTALIDRHGVMRFVNGLLSDLTGYSREELVGRNVEMLVPPQLREMEGEAREEFARDPNVRIIWSDRDLSVMRKDGGELPVDFALSPLVLGGRHWTVGSIRDNTVQRRAEQARRDAERHFRLAFENNMAPMVFTDLRDCIFAANQAFYQMVGRTPKEILGFDSKLFTYPDDVGITEETFERAISGVAGHVRYVKRYLHKDGHMLIAEVSRAAAKDEAGNTQYFIISERDITEEHTLTAQLSHQALHDPLTGLANRALFEDRLAQAQARVARQGGQCALMLLDLDDFKGVNDTHGHLVGDRLLVELARRLEAVARTSDTLCRFGGDEFLFLAEDIAGVEEAEGIAVRLLKALDEPMRVGELMFNQRASLGIVVWDRSSVQETDVVRDADLALYEAKRLGKGRYVFHAPGMHQRVVTQFSLAQELHQALQAGDLSMQYQPIVHLTTGQIVGFEALMRWRHPTRGWVPPDVFIPLAEQSGLILELEEFALHEAVSAASTWQRAATSPHEPYVSVNLSARQFHDSGLVGMVESELASCGLAPDRLILEITESSLLLEVADTMHTMELLTELGIGVALDDFGTGFSSLAYLTQFNPIVIKIDQRFVRTLAENIHHDRVLTAIVSLGNNLGMTVLAEGIETKEQLRRLQGLVCTLGQGFLFSPAVPREEVTGLIGHAYPV